MSKSSAVYKDMMMKAVEALDKKSDAASGERWFSRGDISRQVGAQHGLNPSRVKALKALSEEGGLLLERQKPEEGRQFPQYSLSKNKA